MTFDRVLSPATERAYRECLRRFDTFRGDQPATGDTVRAFLATLTPNVAKLARGALRTQYPDLPWHRLRGPRCVRNATRLRATVLTDEERARLRAVCATPREAALVGALYVLRRAEAAALVWGQLDLVRGVVAVPGKGGAGRPTLLPDAALTPLRAWYAAAGCPGPDAPVFPSGRGRCPNVRVLWRWVVTLLDRAGLRRAYRGPHALRRTFATQYLRAHPADLVGLRDLMRHATIDTTQLYCWLDLEGDLRARLATVDL